MPYVEDLEEWHARHAGPGGDGYETASGWIYYRDGAVRENNAYGVRREPRDDPRERADDLLRYWTLRERRLADEFRRLKLALTMTAKNAGQVPDEELERLSALRELVLDARKMQERMTDKSGHAAAARRQAADRAALERRKDEASAKVNAITI